VEEENRVNLRPALVAALVAAVLAGALPAFRAAALPRYSARYGERCDLCHVNPSGGGMRTTYASQQLVPQEMAWRPATGESLYVPDPQVTRSLVVGADFREVYVGSNVRQNKLDFFQMQGDLYLAFQLEPRAMLYYDRGISTSAELFGVAYLFPYSGYVKAGRFVPSYGWKFDDHTLFVRDALGFAPPSNSDVGVELGFQPGRLTVQLGVLNGSPGSTLDTDNRMAQSANAVLRWNAAEVGFALGASGYHKGGAAGDRDLGGGYGYVTWRGVTWLAEADFDRTDAGAAGRATSFVTSHELSLLARRGLEMFATYDFFDPDKSVESGAKSRWGLGVVVMPRPYLILDARYRRTDFRPGPALDGRDFNETVLQLHVAY
jgi:hypothetical protein